MSNIGFITVHGHYEAISHLIFIQDNAFEHFVWKMVAILSQLQCVNLVYPEELIHYGLVMPFGEDMRPPSHYLSQHWHITNEVLWYWLESNFRGVNCFTNSWPSSPAANTNPRAQTLLRLDTNSTLGLRIGLTSLKLHVRLTSIKSGSYLGWRDQQQRTTEIWH